MDKKKRGRKPGSSKKQEEIKVKKKEVENLEVL